MAMNINKFGIGNSFFGNNIIKKSDENNLIPSSNVIANKTEHNCDNIEISDDYKKWLEENSQTQEEESESLTISNDEDKTDQSSKISNDDKDKDTESLEIPEEEKIGGKVAVNVLKRMRQISAAANRSQIQQVLAILNDDLSDCKAGLEKGWCDQSEIDKVKSLIKTAKEKMSQLPQNEKTEKDSQDYLDEFEFSMASLQ